MTFTPTEHEVAARRVRDTAYHPRARPSTHVPAVDSVVRPWADADDGAPIVWALPVDANGQPTFPAWFTAHQRAAYSGNAPGTFMAVLAGRERRLNATRSAYRELLAKADAVARMLDAATLADARATLACDALKRRGPLT